MAIIMAFGVWGASGLYAQSSAALLEAGTLQGPIDTVGVPQDTLAGIESAELDSAWIQRADSAWWAWCEAGYCLSTDSAIWYAGTASPDLAAELDTARIVRDLADLDRRTTFDMSPHGAILDRISFMMRRRPVFLGKMMGQSPQYFPLFEEALDRYELPQELKYIPVLESALNPVARSRAGATGLWQFMYRTARYFDLEINSWVDERRDPVASTDAACRYLKQLNEMYDGDWHLALAAYNAGPGNVNKAIRRAGTRDFWKVRQYLPRETARYVPSIVALAYLFAHPVESGLVPSHPALPSFRMDTVMLNQNVRFDQVAHVTGRSVAELTQLNPQYRKEVVPGAIGGGWPLVLPREVVGVFIERMPEAFSWEPEQTPEVTFEPEVIVYRVKSGDVLGSIAKRHRVSVRELREWNGLRGDMIRVGQKLYIHGNPR